MDDDQRSAGRGCTAMVVVAVLAVLAVVAIVYGVLALALQDLGREDDPGSVRLGSVEDVRGSVAFTVPPFDDRPPERQLGEPGYQLSIPATSDPVDATLDAAEAIGDAGVDWTRGTCSADHVALDGFEDRPVGPTPIDLQVTPDEDALELKVTVATVDWATGADNEDEPDIRPNCPPPIADRLRWLLASR